MGSGLTSSSASIAGGLKMNSNRRFALSCDIALFRKGLEKPFGSESIASNHPVANLRKPIRTSGGGLPCVFCSRSTKLPNPPPLLPQPSVSLRVQKRIDLACRMSAKMFDPSGHFADPPASNTYFGIQCQLSGIVVPHETHPRVIYC